MPSEVLRLLLQVGPQRRHDHDRQEHEDGTEGGQAPRRAPRERAAGRKDTRGADIDHASVERVTYVLTPDGKPGRLSLNISVLGEYHGTRGHHQTIGQFR
mgnify:CR=1 FL=1